MCICRRNLIKFMLILGATPPLLMKHALSQDYIDFKNILACDLKQSLSNTQAPTMDNTSPTTGNPDLDRALIWEMRSLARFFGINAGVRILPSHIPNASASNRSIVPNTTGTILFSTALIDSELIRQHGGYALAGIAAHETAHIYTFLYQDRNEVKILDQAGSTARELELYADSMAAYYLASMKPNAQWFQTFRRSIGEKGDPFSNSPDHHGTPYERQHAVDFGYSLAARNAPLQKISSQVVNYVLSM